MRAKEFTINVPITITINGDDDPVVNATGQEPEEQEVDKFIPPLQSKLEILKKSVGLDNVYDEEPDELDQMKKRAGIPLAVQQAAADDEPLD
jgi:hypothetical protein